MIADDHLRSAVHGGVPSLLRAPLVGRCIRDRSMEDRPAMQVQEEEYKYLAERNEGAATSVWCATSPQLEDRGGVYCEDCDIAIAVPADHPEPRGARPWACDSEVAERLWRASEEWTGARLG